MSLLGESLVGPKSQLRKSRLTYIGPCPQRDTVWDASPFINKFINIQDSAARQGEDPLPTGAATLKTETFTNNKYIYKH